MSAALPLMTVEQETTLRWRLNDVAFFATHHISSQDIDPVYPVLRYIVNENGLDLPFDEAFWLVELYLQYYSLASALTAFRRYPKPALIDSESTLKLPTGVERRGLRDPNCMRAHNVSYMEVVGEDGGEWMWRARKGIPEEDFTAFWERSQTIKYNGRWAAFKWTELLKEVLGYPFVFPDMRLRECSGPREGLAWLYNVPLGDLTALESCAAHLRYELRLRGVELSWERLETVLCDFNSMRKGHYYVGHDIDQMQEQVEKAAGLHPDDKALIYRARKATIPRAYLGEWGGWSGVDRGRCTAYRDGHAIPIRDHTVPGELVRS